MLTLPTVVQLPFAYIFPPFSIPFSFLCAQVRHARRDQPGSAAAAGITGRGIWGNSHGPASLRQAEGLFFFLFSSLSLSLCFRRHRIKKRTSMSRLCRRWNHFASLFPLQLSWHGLVFFFFPFTQPHTHAQTNEILNLNNQISRMRKELELVQRDTLDLESKKDYNLNVLSNKTLEYGQVMRISCSYSTLLNFHTFRWINVRLEREKKILKNWIA